MNDWQPLSVREGNAWDRLAWAIKDLREAIALSIAPWLRPRGPQKVEVRVDGRKISQAMATRDPERWR